MNSKVFFGHNDIRFIYYRFKDSRYYSLSIIFLTIVVSFVLIAYVIIPRIENYFSIRQEVLDLRMKIKNTNNNISFMNSINRSDLDSKLTTASLALPTDKDFNSILSTISNSALNSGVTLGDYKFAVGNNIPVINAKSSEQSASISMTLIANGDIDKMKRFLKLVLNSFPVSEVSSIDYNKQVATIDLKFYYKPYPKISFHEGESLTPLSNSDGQLIGKISSWKKIDESAQDKLPFESSSNVPLFN